MVHPIQAPIPKTAMNAMNTGIPMSQSLMASRAGQNKAVVYAIAITTQTAKISPPMPWSLFTLLLTSDGYFEF